jgi:toxin-antitoxin system PIN domain toxin
VILDANVLLYAVNTAAPQHERAKKFLEDLLNGESRVGFPWVSLLAFQRIATHPRAFTTPLTAAQAWDIVEGWLEADVAWIPKPGLRYAHILKSLIVGHDLRGNLVSDAQLAALAIENGVALCSYDTDFGRFPSLTWVRPILEEVSIAVAAVDPAAQRIH